MSGVEVVAGAKPIDVALELLAVTKGAMPAAGMHARDFVMMRMRVAFNRRLANANRTPVANFARMNQQRGGILPIHKMSPEGQAALSM